MKLDRKFFERLAWYVFGIAIGLVMLGFIQMKRSQAHQQRAAEQPTAASAPATPPEPADPTGR